MPPIGPENDGRATPSTLRRTHLATIPELLGQGEGGLGLIIIAEPLESPAFAVPGRCKLRIDLDRLLEARDGAFDPGSFYWFGSGR